MNFREFIGCALAFCVFLALGYFVAVCAGLPFGTHGFGAVMGTAVMVGLCFCWIGCELLPENGRAIPETSKPSADDRKVAELRSWFPIGSTFKHLSREMAVTGHERWMAGFCTIFAVPCLRADYADDNGVVRSAELGYAEAKAIHEAQPKRAKGRRG